MTTGKHEQPNRVRRRRRRCGARRPLGPGILIGLLAALICGGCDFGPAPAPDALGTPITMPGSPAVVDPAITVIVIHAAATATPVALPPTPTVPPAATATLPPPTAVPARPVGVVLSGKLRVREGPGTRYPVLTTLDAGTPLDVAGRAQGLDWLKVRLPGGQEGWVSADLVQLNVDRAAVPAGYFRPLTGMIHTGTGPQGHGELRLQNSNTSDRLVVVTRNTEPEMSVYLRAGESFTIDGIADGTYRLYYSQGDDWDGTAFTRNVKTSRSSGALLFTTTDRTYSTWNIDIFVPSGGNTDVEAIPRDAFPVLPPDQDKDTP
ncbi:MAG TPA: SH3 domain-containing protein [Chloroflexia bacterium]|nr:SH3 domain-containing protein [Chloroflexia bacterium]